MDERGGGRLGLERKHAKGVVTSPGPSRGEGLEGEAPVTPAEEWDWLGHCKHLKSSTSRPTSAEGF